MSTFLDRKAVCGHCGRANAEQRCPCKGTSYCNQSCQRAAWSEHRLSCTKARPPTSPSGFGLGDVVLIEGLQSAAGQTMNGRLAEVIQVDAIAGDRIGVLVASTGDNSFDIKSAKLKPENLTLRLAAHEAAKRAAANIILKGEPNERDIQTKQQEFHLECIRVGRAAINSPLADGTELVRRIGEGDSHLIQALLLCPSIAKSLGEPPIPEVSPKLCEAMMKAGLIDVCLRHLKFPELMDLEEEEEGEPRKAPPVQYLTILCNFLNKGSFGFGRAGSLDPVKESRLNKYRVEACRKLGPAILLCANKKRRLKGQTEHWLGAQAPMMGLLGNCLMAEGAASSVLLQELDPAVTTALLEHLAFALTVDPKLFLRQCTIMSDELLKKVPAMLKVSALPVLVELVDIATVGVQRVAHDFGNLLIPRGAPYGLAGRKFVECWLDVAALVSMEELDSGNARRGGLQLIEELQYVYGQFWNVPSIQRQLGEFDDVFGYLTNPDELRRWSKGRIDTLSSW